MDSYDAQLIANFVGTLVIVFIVYVIWLLIKCFASYRAFKLCNHKNPWAAFVPFYNKVVLSECTGQLEANVFKRVPIEVFRFWIIAHYVMYLLSFIPFIGLFNFIFGIACKMFCYKWVYIRLKRSAVAWGSVAAFFSCFLGIIPVIVFFTSKSENTWNDDTPYVSYSNTEEYNSTYSDNSDQNSGGSGITFN